MIKILYIFLRNCKCNKYLYVFIFQIEYDVKNEESNSES